MEDAFRFISAGFSHLVTFGFVRIYRYFPALFRYGYQYSERHPGVFKEDSGIYKLLTAGAERLRRYIAENGYDAIICTHVFSALIVSEDACVTTRFPPTPISWPQTILAVPAAGKALWTPTSSLTSP